MKLLNAEKRQCLEIHAIFPTGISQYLNSDLLAPVTVTSNRTEAEKEVGMGELTGAIAALALVAAAIAIPAVMWRYGDKIARWFDRSDKD